MAWSAEKTDVDRGDRFRQAREKDPDRTKEGVADSIGVSRITIRHIEKGDSTNIHTASLLAELYGESLDYLLLGRGDPMKAPKRKAEPSSKAWRQLLRHPDARGDQGRKAMAKIAAMQLPDDVDVDTLRQLLLQVRSALKKRDK